MAPLDTMPMQSLKRTGTNEYEAMLTAKAEMPTWNVPTLLLRFTEQNGACALFSVTKEAMVQFKTLEMNTIYRMKISGRAVQNNVLGIKFGVKGTYEVKMQFALKDLKKATTAWPLQLHYEMIDFGDLQQTDVGVFVDISGRLLSKDTPPQNSSLSKITFTLQHGELMQGVELLGRHAGTVAKVGDMVTIKSVLVKEFNKEKRLETSFLSVVEVNPNKRKGVPDLPSLADMDGEPPRKAIKLELKPHVSTEYANTRLNKMLEDAKAGEEVEPLEFVLRCKLEPFDDEFFANNAPFVGPEDGEKVRLPVLVSDSTGEMRVVIWTSAAAVLLKITKEQLRKIWEAGEDTEKDRPELLKKLNSPFDNFFLLSCTGKVWKNQIDVNVNNAADVSDTE